jgi:hypothetical protein
MLDGAFGAFAWPLSGAGAAFGVVADGGGAPTAAANDGEVGGVPAVDVPDGDALARLAPADGGGVPAGATALAGDAADCALFRVCGLLPPDSVGMAAFPPLPLVSDVADGFDGRPMGWLGAGSRLGCIESLPISTVVLRRSKADGGGEPVRGSTIMRVT